MKTFRMFSLAGAAVLLLALIALAGAPSVAAAPTCTTDCYVSPTGNDANDGATAATPLLTIQLAINTVTSGGTVHLAAGTFTQDTVVNKSVTIDGEGPALTFIDPSNIGLDISADDVVVQDLALINAGTHGARVFRNASTVLRPKFSNVYFTTNASRGLEISGSATDVVVADCVFDGNKTGIRSASTAVITGMDVLRSTFKNHTDASSGIGIYQANDGNAGNMSDLTVSDSVFENNGFAAIYGEEMRDVLISDNTFQNEARGLLLFDFFAASATATGPFTIQTNTFTDHTASAISLQFIADGLDLDAFITGNVFNQSAALPALNWAQIDLRFNDDFSHAPVHILSNAITFSGSFGGGATALYGIKLRGGPDTVEIFDNTLDGGNIGDIGGLPATSGLYVASNVATYGAPKASTVITAQGNLINNFVNAIAVYNEVTPGDGGLPAGAALVAHRNDLSDNGYGVRSGAGEDTTATCNWWGAADGPGPVGPGSGSDVSTDVVYFPWLLTDDLAAPCLGPIFVAPSTGGVTDDALAFGPDDILLWDGGWSKFFDGNAAGLMPNGKAKHSINAFYIPDPGQPAVLLSFAQNARFVPGVSGKVDGMDIVSWDGATFQLVFDGQDVGLTVLTNEKLDAFYLLPGTSAPAPLLAAAGGSCQAYMLASTQGPGKVPNYSGGTLKFSGEDILGFCFTSNGDITAGKWIMVLDASAQGAPRNSLTGLSVSTDENTFYLTTRDGFHVDSANGNHSMIYAYDRTTQTFSGPYWKAADFGLHVRVADINVIELP